jgi:hypothetical protein
MNPLNSIKVASDPTLSLQQLRMRVGDAHRQALSQMSRISTSVRNAYKAIQTAIDTNAIQVLVQLCRFAKVTQITKSSPLGVDLKMGKLMTLLGK